ncbi:NADPH-dependent oxidoreductase [Bacteroides sp. 224]|uniref:NADPH-dependent oxidoreductase n=1 Tax=Bacteroides sp. 224 TaxID=2302936 RepID=UPI0013D7DBA2|nr:NADPH-dependent oxidoreductase [Bacteroides sp. 224]
MESMKNRRTIRKYKQETISSELLNDLLETAFRASTTGNMQLYSVVVTRDKEMLAQLSPAHYNQKPIQTAPVVLTFCADFNRFCKWCEERKAVPGYNNFQSFMNAAMDALIVAQTFCTAAEDKGLGICYLGTTTYNPQMIIKTLQLPKLVFPIATITVGYPDECPELVDRLPIEGIIHEETYKDYSPADIDRLYSFKESLAINKKFIEENQKETLAQVFTDIRYSKKDNEAITENLFKVIREQGFE